jgi:hypothetical protein
MGDDEQYRVEYFRRVFVLIPKLSYRYQIQHSESSISCFRFVALDSYIVFVLGFVVGLTGFEVGEYLINVLLAKDIDAQKILRFV